MQSITTYASVPLRDRYSVSESSSQLYQSVPFLKGKAALLHPGTLASCG